MKGNYLKNSLKHFSINQILVVEFPNESRFISNIGKKVKTTNKYSQVMRIFVIQLHLKTGQPSHFEKQQLM